VRLASFVPGLLPDVVDVWNAAAGDALPLGEALFQQNTVDDPHFNAAGCVVARAASGGRVVGFCLAKVAQEPIGTDGLLPNLGWISMLAVHPDWQGRGFGMALLRAGEAFLRLRRRAQSMLGGDPAHFFPGIPDETGTAPFFEHAGYALRGDAYDLRRSLRGYQTPPTVAAARAAASDLEIRPLTPGDRRALFAFLDATFPGRWRYTIARFLESGAPIGDVMGVVGRGGVLGFAHLFHPGSQRIGPSIAWGGSDAGAGAVGGLGPMGIAPAIRGRGLGLALVDRAAVHLAALGAHEMVVDWTVLLDFYGKLGFTPCRRYRHGARRL